MSEQESIKVIEKIKRQCLIVNSTDAFDGQVGIGNREISIETGPHDKGVYIKYCDNAGGMPEEVRQRIFEPFYTTKDPGKGTGFGMSISKGVVDQHKGTITVVSQLSVGTTFEIFLPQVEFERTTEKEECAVSVPLQKFSTDKPGILVVDNDEKIGLLLNDFLSKYFAVKLIVQPAHGLIEVKRNIFELILCNFMMPEVSGLDIAVAAQKSQPATPIWLMSDFEWNEKSIKNAKRNGVTAIIQKPFGSMDDLMDKIIKTLHVG